MQGGKTLQRRSVADDPTKGAFTSIILPNAGSLVYPVLGALRQPRQATRVFANVSFGWDSIGSGSVTANGNNPATWTHGIVGNAVLASLHVLSVGGGPTGITAEVGGATPGSGSAMTEVLHATYAGPIFNNFATLYVWQLFGGPTGTQTVRILGSNWASSATWTANSISYNNVGSIGTLASGSGGGNVSQAASSVAGELVVSFMANTDLGHSADSGFTAFNGTTRDNRYVTTGPNQQPLLIGELPGAATVTATASGASDCPWEAALVPLHR